MHRKNRCPRADSVLSLFPDPLTRLDFVPPSNSTPAADSSGSRPRAAEPSGRPPGATSDATRPDEGRRDPTAPPPDV